ncbi:MAG: hypothetical protein WCZ89_01535 [Phycisphaerae bacterium]
MKASIDVKTLIIGILTGLVLALVMGQTASTANKADFGISLDRTSFAIVRADDGTLYAIDPQNTRAEVIQYRSGPYKGRAFNLTLPAEPVRR